MVYLQYGMYYYDQTRVWEQERQHFKSLPLDTLRNGYNLTVEEVETACRDYLQKVFLLDFLKDDKERFIDPQTHDIYSGCDFDTSYSVLASESGETVVSAYQRKLTEILILDPGTSEEVRKGLLANSNKKVTLLYNSTVQMQEDYLDLFFHTKTFDGAGIDSTGIAYLRSKLEGASMEFYAMCDNDKELGELIDKMISDDDRPLDHQYQNLWNKKMAGSIRAQEERTQVVDQIIDTLELGDIHILTRVGNFHLPPVILEKLSKKRELLEASKKK